LIYMRRGEYMGENLSCFCSGKTVWAASILGGLFRDIYSDIEVIIFHFLEGVRYCMHVP